MGTKAKAESENQLREKRKEEISGGETMKLLAEKLKDFRRALGLTQREFSKQSGISESLICKIERTNTYQPKTVERIAQHYPEAGFEQYI